MSNRPQPNRARTKIIATVGPACRSQEQLAELVNQGVDVFRLNLAHASLDEHEENLRAIREVSRQSGRPIGVLADLAGPKIRLNAVPGDILECVAGEEVCSAREPRADMPTALTTTYAPFVDELSKGDSVLLADGTVRLKVIDKQSDAVRCRVIQPGEVRSRQGVNLPGVKLSAPALGPQDRRAADWAAEHEVDYLGLSFVRSVKDVLELKTLLRSHGSPTKVIAKIEKPEALEQLDAIIGAADGIMVARGDLGVEIDVAQMPVVQKEIVQASSRWQKPVIIATQMLDSMQHSRQPTRAEVTDVANAILDGADACMLSGETAIGQYPSEAVEMMNRVALATEELLRAHRPERPGEMRAEGLHAVTSAVVYGAALIAAELGARLIVVASHSGATAITLAKQRNYIPTIGISDSPHTLRQMSLYWGVIPLAEMPADNPEAMLEAVSTWGQAEGTLTKGDYVVLVSGIRHQGGAHNQLLVQRVP